MRTIYGLAFAAAFGLFLVPTTWAEEGHGPNKGAVVEWGDEEYHLEVVPDVTTGAVTVFVYGNHADLHKGTRKAIEPKSIIMTLKTTPAKTIKLDAAPEKTDPAGKSSKFVAKDDSFKGSAKLGGTISGKLGTKPYSGDFQQK